MGTLRRASVLSIGVALALVSAGCGGSSTTQAAASTKPIIIGLITKTDANPFFVKMRQGAEREALAKGAVLLTGAGKDTSDTAGEATALENMVSAGAKAILITPDSAGGTPAVRKGRTPGAIVVAPGTPAGPAGAAHAPAAPHNTHAGTPAGPYAPGAAAGHTAV